MRCGAARPKVRAGALAKAMHVTHFPGRSAVILLCAGAALLAATAAPLSAGAQSGSANSVDAATQASEDVEYNQELNAAAASLKADIQAESDASAAAVKDAEAGPSPTGLIAAGVIAVLGLLALVIIVPATLKARRRRRAMVADMISGKTRRKKK